LKSVGLEKAKVNVLAIDSHTVTLQIVKQVRSAGLQTPILVRNGRGRDDDALIALGADIFSEGLETSLAFAGQLLSMLNVPHSLVETKLNAIRAEDYASIRTFFHASREDKAIQQEQNDGECFQALVISEGDYAVGKTVQELQLECDGVLVLEVRRSAIKVPVRLLDTRIRSGDVLLIKGTAEALEIATTRLRER
jgi:CPA2 family monovalent cation:H+ antiporter-2